MGFVTEKQRKRVMMILNPIGYLRSNSSKNHGIPGKASEKNRMLLQKKSRFIQSDNPDFYDGLWEQLEEEYGKLLKTSDLPMSPGEFLRATNSDPNWVPDHGKASVKRLKMRMENGKEIDKPFLIYYPEPTKEMLQRNDPRLLKNGVIIGHDGRHRAYVAKKLGIQKVPVDIYCSCHNKKACNKCKHVTVEMINKAQPQLLSDRSWLKMEMKERKKFDVDQEKSAKEREKIEAVFDN